MLFGFVGLVCLISIPLAGGRLGRLADVHLRLVWVAVLGLAVQITIISVLPAHGAQWTHTLPHVFSYVLVGMMLYANRHIPWLWLIALGGVLNFVCIVANEGVMPASDWARDAAGMATAGPEFVNSGVLRDPVLLFLGDVFPFPAPWSPNVFSVGDVAIGAGFFLCLHTLTGSRLGTAEGEDTSADRMRALFGVLAMMATGVVVLFAAFSVIAQVSPAEATAACFAMAAVAAVLVVRARVVASQVLRDPDLRSARNRQRERRGF